MDRHTDGRASARPARARRAARRGAGVLVALLLALGPALLTGVAPAAAAGGPFPCQPGFYQVLSGQLKQLNPLTGVYTPIGSASGAYNAIGFNVEDGYIYGLSSVNGTKGDLLRIAADGSVTDLGLPSGLPVSGYVSGDFDDSGNLIVQANAGTYYSIEVSTNVATPFTVTGATANANDMVWIDGVVYSLSGTTLYAVDLSTKIATSATVAGVQSGSFGSGWSDRPDELFYSDNNTGHIYKITDFTTSTPSATLALTGVLTSNNDGAACKQAESPFERPTANDDSFTTTIDRTLEATAANGVLANDVGSGLTATLDATTTHGMLVLDTDGSFTYSPDSGYLGSDSFTYSVTDQFGRTSASPATVTIDVSLPAAPVATDDSFQTIAGAPVSVDALHGVLTNDAGTGITVTAATQPVYGTATVGADGSLTYAPADGDSGTETFTYTITDAYGRSATATVTVKVAPVARPDSYDVTGDEPLTVAAVGGVLADDTGRGLTAAPVDGPAHGTLALGSDGGFTYTPDSGYTETDTFTYAAIDTDGGTTAPQTVTLSVDAPPPPTTTTAPPSSTTTTTSPPTTTTSPTPSLPTFTPPPTAPSTPIDPAAPAALSIPGPTLAPATADTPVAGTESLSLMPVARPDVVGTSGEAAPAASLAYTGSDVLPIATVAWGLLLVGLLLLMRARAPLAPLLDDDGARRRAPGREHYR